MIDFKPIRITGPARELHPKRIGASFLLPIEGTLTQSWRDAFNSYPWTTFALKERNPVVVSDGADHGIGLALSVFESPATPWSMTLDVIEQAIEELNAPFVAAATEATEVDANQEATSSAKISAAQAAIEADWNERSTTRRETSD